MACWEVGDTCAKMALCETCMCSLTTRSWCSPIFLTLFLGEGVVLTENGMITLPPTCDAEGRSRRYDRICFSTIIHIGHLLLWLSLALFMTLGIKPAFVSRMAGLPTDSTSLFVILFFIILGWFSFSFAVLVFSSFALIILSFSIPLFTFSTFAPILPMSMAFGSLRAVLPAYVAFGVQTRFACK